MVSSGYPMLQMFHLFLLMSMTGCPDRPLVSGLRMFKTYDREPLSAHELHLEVAFQKNTCFIRNLEGADLLSGSRDINLYIISLDDMLKTSPICLLSKASKTKRWLWHRRLSHLNFGTLNKLAKDDLTRGKDNKVKKSKKQAKTDKERKRQVQERDLRKISKPDQPTTRKQVKAQLSSAKDQC
ncbi:retrovirus-related pol polyprotein from transposon TNT 1-94 [Tanacetum coccineum]